MYMTVARKPSSFVK